MFLYKDGATGTEKILLNDWSSSATLGDATVPWVGTKLYNDAVSSSERAPSVRSDLRCLVLTVYAILIGLEPNCVVHDSDEKVHRFWVE